MQIVAIRVLLKPRKCTHTKHAGDRSLQEAWQKRGEERREYFIYCAQTSIKYVCVSSELVRGELRRRWGVGPWGWRLGRGQKPSQKPFAFQVLVFPFKLLYFRLKSVDAPLSGVAGSHFTSFNFYIAGSIAAMSLTSSLTLSMTSTSSTPK